MGGNPYSNVQVPQFTNNNRIIEITKCDDSVSSIRWSPAMSFLAATDFSGKIYL